MQKEPKYYIRIRGLRRVRKCTNIRVPIAMNAERKGLRVNALKSSAKSYETRAHFYGSNNVRIDNTEGARIRYKHKGRYDHAYRSAMCQVPTLENAGVL